MITIIVPTDFSAAAENATVYAGHLAKETGASVLLLHVYQIPVTMSDFPVLIVSAEDLKKAADEGLAKAKEAAMRMVGDVAFETESRLGDVVEEVEDVCSKKKPVYLVTGTKDMSGFERFLFGNTTLSLIKRSSVPVIAVPQGAKAGTPKNIVLATDLLNVAEIPTEKIVSVTKMLGAKLHVVHVEGEEEQKASPAALMESLKEADAAYHTIKEDDVSEGLKHFVETNNIDLVLILPHKHNLYERLFFKGHTEGILRNMPVPVMSLR